MNRSRKYNFSDQDKAAISAAYLKGESVKSLAARYGCGKSLMFQRIVDWGFHKPKKNIYSVNEHFFSSVDSEVKAYWLGFLAADGAIKASDGCYHIRLGLQAKDGHWVERFIQDIQYSGEPFTDKKRVGDKTFLTRRVKISSKQLVSDLVRHGVVERKSLTLSWPKDLAVDLERHFARGYFDGDGCFNAGYYEIVSSPIFARQFAEVADRHLGVTYRLPKAGKNSSRAIFKTRDTPKIFNWLYDGATVFLPRKKLLAEEFITQRTSGNILAQSPA